MVEVVSSSPHPKPPSVFKPDGSLNVANLTKLYGLGVEEATQEIQWGAYSGTVAQMLDDARCPVGGRLQVAYREEGIAGVIGAFEGLRTLDPGFKVEISDETLLREREKKIGSPRDSEFNGL